MKQQQQQQCMLNRARQETYKSIGRFLFFSKWHLLRMSMNTFRLY